MYPWEFADELTHQTSVAGCIEAAHGRLKELGFRNLLYASLEDRSSLDDGPNAGAPRLVRYSTIDRDYEARYAEQRYHEVCPIYRAARRGGHLPIVWSDIFDRTESSPRWDQMRDEFGSVGINYGVSVTIHDPVGGYAGIGISTDLSRRETDRLIGRTLSEVFALCHFLHNAMVRLTGAPPPQRPAVELTERERDCLLWAARGLCSWEIGEILGIGRDTVDFHLANVRRKFDVPTRTAAVAAAYECGLLSP